MAFCFGGIFENRFESTAHKFESFLGGLTQNIVRQTDHTIPYHITGKESVHKYIANRYVDQLPGQAMQAPFNWSHAKLEDVRLFLLEQAKQGVWRPKVDFGLL